MFVLQMMLNLTKTQSIMKYYLSVSIITMLTLFAVGSCTSPSSKPTESETLSKSDVSVQTGKSDPLFPLPDIPVMITDPEESMVYLSKHYWDLFPFADTTLITQPEITEQGLVDYIQLLNQIAPIDAQNSINTLLDKAKLHPTMYLHFVSLLEKYLYDPNSPFRSDEHYIVALQHFRQSGLLSLAKQEVYGFQLEMTLKNRAGSTATNFAYTTANGDKQMMHALQSNYLILFFTNPDCPSCAETTELLVNSKALQGVFLLNSSASSMLTVLSIYPDSNIEEWRKALPRMPQQHWVNAYDEGTVVTNKRLYDIKAIPTLYLLDKNKKVILKDSTLEEIEEFFMRIR